MDMREIQAFCDKWSAKFADPDINYLELVEYYMGDECAALGFEMDCGHAFTEKYGEAATNHSVLERIISQVDDIQLLGSAIFSQWRYFNHWAYSGSEILAPENRAWFITALARLNELAGTPVNDECQIIIFPDFVVLKDEVEKFRTEISMLVLERDELLMVDCKNIEMAYMLELGGLEYKAYELECAVLRVKRKLGMIQAKKNRQEKIILALIEELLDEEFAAYKAKLDEHINKMNNALKRSKGKTLSAEDTKELKALYRAIVKSMHPDLNPDISEAQLKLFKTAVEAYKNGDVESMRIIGAMVSTPKIIRTDEDSMTKLRKEKERLEKLIIGLREKIETIKGEYPYTLKVILQNEDTIQAKKEELEQAMKQWNEALIYYQARVDELLR